jgi:hypothetical protein
MCAISHTLYYIYGQNVNSNQYTLNELIFADDQCLIYPNEKELQEHLHALEDGRHQHNMKISSTKTEVMKFARVPTPIDVQVGNNKIKQVKEFKYLGSCFTEDGRIDREIEIRIQRANSTMLQLAPILKHTSINMNTKRLLINNIFIPTLC